MLVRKLKYVGLVACAVTALALCSPLAVADSITQFDFSFASGNGNVSGNGILYVTENAGGLSYTANSGSITLPDSTVVNTSGSNSTGFTGNFDLDPITAGPVYSGPSPDGSNYHLSPSGYFYFDDQLYYSSQPQLPGGSGGGDLASNGNVTPTSGPGEFLLDVGGLLFSYNAPSGLEEINLYQSGDYIYYENNGMNEVVNFTLTPVPVGNTSTSGGSAVPLPAAVNVGFGMLAGCGFLAGLRKRLRRSRRSSVGV